MTREQYQEALANLENIAPNHALMPRLRKGYGALNKEYMRRVLEELYIDRKVPDDSDPILRSMWASISKKLAQRSIMSNGFHDLRTDADRKAHSQRIQVLQASLADDFGRTDVYRATGELPRIQEDDRNDQELPDDPGALYRKIHSLRTMISQVKRELEQLASMVRSEQTDERIDTLHKRLKNLENDLARAKRKYQS